MPQKQFAIRKTNSFFVDTPGPPRRVEENIRIGECYLTVTDETDLSDLTDPLIEKTYTGYGIVVAQTMDGQVVPQELPFTIEADSVEEAFMKFEESIEAKISELGKEQNSILPPTPDEMAALSNESSGIIVP